MLSTVCDAVIKHYAINTHTNTHKASYIATHTSLVIEFQKFVLEIVVI